MSPGRCLPRIPELQAHLPDCCMQRLREMIRGWAADQTIRDVSLLNEARRAIEFQMVRPLACLTLAKCM